MYQAQIQNGNLEWEAAGKPTPSFSEAMREATELAEWLVVETRVVCVDSAPEWTL